MTDFLLYLVKGTVELYIDLTRLSLLISTILPSTPSFKCGVLSRFCYAVSEATVQPVKKIICPYTTVYENSFNTYYFLTMIIVTVVDILLTLLI